MPARLKEFAAAAGEYGWTLEGGGSKHPYRLRKPGFRVYPCPAHNGLKSEMDDHYLRGFCRLAGIDWNEFRSKL